MHKWRLACASAGVAGALIGALSPALAGESTANASAITVTATRLAEPALTLPQSITLVSGAELRAQGRMDWRRALSASAGVQLNPGGDGGPAGGVVAMQGLAEMDAYLLLVDGVPHGGAFNPATATLDLIDVERIEILHGAAPVTYGATSFVGVIHALRYGAGEQPGRWLLQGGTNNSARGAFAFCLPKWGRAGQSLLGSYERRDFAQDRGGFRRGHLLYRMAADTGPGRLHLDLDGTTLDQTPYSPHPREGAALSTRFPLDANINPSDARQDEDRLQANLGLDASLGAFDWNSIVAVAHTRKRITRGFLRSDFATDGTSINADGYRQRVSLTDVYADSHVSARGGGFEWIAGIDLLYGNGNQRSQKFEYAVQPDGFAAPSSTSRAIDEATVLQDKRLFLGAYGQIVARPLAGLTLLAGVRLNHTREHRCGGEAQGDATPAAEDCMTRHRTRLSGSVGLNAQLLKTSGLTLHGFASYRNTYKPAAIDFGPEAEADILEPETTSAWEAGLKGVAAANRLSFELSYFDTRFRNLVIRENIGGLPALANAGRQQLSGFEAELRYQPFRALTATLSYARHLARFTDYARLRPDGSLQQLAGKQLELSPRNLASGSITFAPGQGVQLAVSLNYAGKRFLNKGNTAIASGYATLDSRIGWRFADRWALFVEAENLTDRRDAVAESELGDAQFYRLPGRRILLTASRGF